MADNCILITGAAGFIGSHCVVALAEGELDILKNQSEILMFMNLTFSWL